ncbi:hypothetical protein F5X96DRAFT_669910 [Biscogniauxia mediterranea]|nr:hypothetical protein F5X96DRAFT_669910 [Biscogniauxia mediterranea]
MTDKSCPEGGGNMPTHQKPMSDELAAMMADLGLERVEVLARDDADIAAHRPSAEPTQALASGPIEPSNPLASAYHDAIQQGAFDDDDSRAVRHLDPLDGGNAHRLNRSRHPRHGNQRSTPVFARRIRRYDPFNPGFRARPRPTTVIRMPDGNQAVGSLGGLIPPGGAVRRWSYDRPGGLAKHPFQLSARTRSPITVKKALSNGNHAKTWVSAKDTPSPSKLPLTGIASMGDVSKSQQTSRAPSSNVVDTVTPQSIPKNLTTTSPDLSENTQKYQAEGNNTRNAIEKNAWKKTLYPSREIFFEAECVKMVGPPIQSWVCIYELSDKRACHLELHTMGGSVIYEDICQLPELKIDGQNVFSYHQNKSGLDNAPCTNILRFDSNSLAKHFAEEVQRRTSQFTESDELIHMGHIDPPMQDGDISTDRSEEAHAESDGSSTSSRITSSKQVTSDAIPSQLIRPPCQAPEVESLIDIGGDQLTEPYGPAPTPGYGRYHEDLEGLQYHFSAKNTPTSYYANGSEEVLGGNHEGMCLRYSVICPDIASIDTVPAGEELSMESLSILSRVKSESYRDMILASKTLANVVNDVMSAPEDSPASTFAAAQIASLHLAKDQEFGALSKSEKNRVIAVVYRNILNGLSGKITWSSRELLGFCPSQKAACPNEVSEVNAMNEKWWEQRRKSPSSPQPLPYSPSMVQKNSKQNAKFLFGNRDQGDATLASTSGPREDDNTQSAVLASGSPPNIPQVTSASQTLLSPQSSRELSGLRREEYVTSSYTVTAQTPEGTSSVPRVIAPESTQTTTSLSSSNVSSPKGLAASRWNSPQVTPQVAGHQQTGSNASTRSTISRLAHGTQSL